MMAPESSVNVSHPYYPLDLHLPHYKENSLSVEVIIGLIAVFFAVFYLITWMVVRKDCFGRHLGLEEKAILCWFGMSGCIHVIFEGYLTLNSGTIAGNNSILAQISCKQHVTEPRHSVWGWGLCLALALALALAVARHQRAQPDAKQMVPLIRGLDLGKEYAKGDSRYVSNDTCTVVMENITVWLEGPGCFITVWAFLSRNSMRHVMQLAVSIGQFYGVLIYFISEYFEDFAHGPRFHPYYFWVYVIGFNAPWVIIPPILIRQSWRELNKAQMALDKTNGFMPPLDVFGINKKNK